jgi:hypothetical protein
MAGIHHQGGPRKQRLVAARQEQAGRSSRVWSSQTNLLTIRPWLSMPGGLSKLWRRARGLHRWNSWASQEPSVRPQENACLKSDVIQMKTFLLPDSEMGSLMRRPPSSSKVVDPGEQAMKNSCYPNSSEWNERRTAVYTVVLIRAPRLPQMCRHCGAYISTKFGSYHSSDAPCQEHRHRCERWGDTTETASLNRCGHQRVGMIEFDAILSSMPSQQFE